MKRVTIAAMIKTILVIDDDDVTRELVAMLIRKRGFVAVTAANGREGIEVCKKVIPDTVFLDIMMPDINGDEVFKEIKKIDPDILVYFISGSDYELNRLYSQNIRGEGFFSKPVSVVTDLNRILDDLKKAKKE